MRKHIPNTITCSNLLSGCVATMFAFEGAYQYAFAFIIAGAVFDFFDGLTARALKVSSPIGKELDSLADVITFGFAPAAMVFSWLRECADVNLDMLPAFAMPFVAFLLAAFSALRLAKFNVDERQTSSFIGLPTPANALFWGALIVGIGSYLERYDWTVFPILFMLLVSCYLLISEIPMFALKFKHWSWQGNEVKYIFLMTCIPLLGFFGLVGLAIIIAWYVVLSLIVWLLNNKKQEN